MKGVVSLAGITNFRSYGAGCGGAVKKLLGGSIEEVPLRYQETSPMELLPLRIAQRLIHGGRDQIVPPAQSTGYEAAARKKGDDAVLVTVEEAGHFDLIAPVGSAWVAVKEAVSELLKEGKQK